LGRPRKEIVEARKRLKEDEELLRKRKEALRLLLDKGMELMQAGKISEGRQCLRQSEEMMQSLGIVEKPDKEQEKEKEEGWTPFTEEREEELAQDPVLSKVAEDVKNMTKKEYRKEMSKDEGLFMEEVEITPEMLGLPREKEEKKEERPTGDEKTRRIIRKKLGLEEKKKGLRIRRRTSRKEEETAEKKEQEKKSKLGVKRRKK